MVLGEWRAGRVGALSRLYAELSKLPAIASFSAEWHQSSHLILCKKANKLFPKMFNYSFKSHLRKTLPLPPSVCVSVTTQQARICLFACCEKTFQINSDNPVMMSVVPARIQSFALI